jgi:hypothetical protein
LEREWFMPLLRAFPLALALLLAQLAGVTETRAQFAPPATPPNACAAQLMSLKQDVEKKFLPAKAAMERKAPPPELCKLFAQFADAEGKFLKYAEEQGVWCGFPAEALTNLKASHSQSLNARKQVCAVAANMQQQQQTPAAPRLSDALGSPITSGETTRTGRGTLDTLNGNPLAR